MQTVSTDQLVGQTVGHYTVKSLLGRGRLSAVYLAQHPSQNHSAALTTFIIPDRFTSDARTRFTQRFTREAAALTALSHRNLLSIHEYGEQFGYPYLITPYMTNGSLADTLKQQGRCTPAYALEVLEQVAAGLDYAHRKGVFHGTLKPSNILLNTDQNLLVAGFGLVHMLQMRGIEQNDQPYSYLLSVADTFLYASAYIAPEVVQGQPIDSRSDIYALGVILFELLSGKPPFSGTSPLDTAMQHVQRSIPSLHKLSPDIPISMELVVNHALARDPSQRFQRVSELVEAFSQVCKGSVSRSPNAFTNDSAPVAAVAKPQNNLQNAQEEPVSLGGWQVMQPFVNGKSATAPSTGNTDSWQILPPIVTGRLAAVRPSQPQQQPAKPPVQPPIVRQPAANLLLPNDPFQARNMAPPVQPVQPVQKAPAEPLVKSLQPAQLAQSVPARSGDPTISDADDMKTPTWWIQAPSPLAASVMAKTKDGSTKTSSVEQSNRQQAPDSVMRIRPIKRARGMGRRRAIATIATGGVVAAGALVAFKLNLLHLPTTATPPVAQGGVTTGKPNPTNNGGKTNTGGTTNNGGTVNKGNGGTVNKGTGNAAPVLAKANAVPVNSSMTIVNPADGKNSLIIHLTNGNFVAYESACTHVGVTVAYDPASHTLVCPAHGAVFDPAKKALVLQGPAQRPLKPVAIHVSADGTITAG